MSSSFRKPAQSREQSFRHLRERLQGADDGSGSAIVVAGSPRSGRTRFLDDIQRMHRGPVVFLAGPPDASAPADVTLLPLLVHLDIAATAPSGTIGLLGEEILRAVSQVPDDHPPLLVVVDDAELLPAPTRAVIAYIARRLAHRRVLLVLATTDPVDPVWDSIPQIPMYTLGRDETADLVEAVTGHRPASTALTEIHRIGRGNPADIHELCTALTVAELQGTAVLPVPVAVSQRRTAHWRGVLAQVTDSQRAALVILSMVPAIGPDRLAEVLAGPSTDVPDPAEGIAALVTQGHLRTVDDVLEVANRLDRAAIYTVAPTDLRRHCRRLVDGHALLHGRPALALANRAFTESIESVGATTEIITRTSELARSGAPARAIQVLRRTLRIAEPLLRTPLAAHGLRLATELGYLDDAEHFAEHIDWAVLPPREWYPAAAAMVCLRYLRDQPIDTAGVHHAVRVVGEECPSSAAALAAISAAVHLARHETTEAQQSLSLGHPPVAEAGTDPAVLLTRAHLSFQAGEDPAEAIRLLSAADSLTGVATASEAMLAATLLHHLGRYRQSGDRIDLLLSRGASLPPIERALAISVGVDNELAAGEIGTARIFWEDADFLAPAVTHLPSLRLCQRVHILGLSGRFDEAQDLAERIRASPTRRTQLADRSRLLGVLGQIALMRGDGELAIAHLEQSIDMFDSVAGQWQLQRHLDLVEAFVVAQQPETAEAVLHSTALRLAAIHTPTAKALLARGRLLVATTKSDAHTALGRALGTPADPVPALDRARAHAIYSVRMRENSQLALHAGHQRTARSLFQRIGAVGWIDGGRWVDAAAPEADVSDPRLAVLGDTERQIVALVVQGLRNREIGVRLFISQRTVEKHLTAVFRKLGIRSRAALFTFSAPTTPGAPQAEPRATTRTRTLSLA